MLRTDDRAATDSAPVESPVAWDAPGGHGIRERRSWHTWQLTVVVVVAIFVGMALGYYPDRHSGGNASASTTPFTLPPRAPLNPAGGTTATTAAADTGGSTQTTGATTDTTLATGTAPTGATTSGPAVVLVGARQGTGPASMPAFTTAGAWKIGWAFRCVLASGGSGTFTVVDSGGAPLVNETGRQSQGVTPETATGAHHLQIQTDPSCAWAIKVTGVAG